MGRGNLKGRRGSGHRSEGRERKGELGKKRWEREGYQQGLEDREWFGWKEGI